MDWLRQQRYKVLLTLYLFFFRVRSAVRVPDKDEAATRRVLEDVMRERVRQNHKWGQQTHPYQTGPDYRLVGSRKNSEAVARLKYFNDYYGQPYWSLILAEEFYEAMCEVDPEKLREELVQVAAVAVSWIEDIDRRQRAGVRSTSTVEWSDHS
jgi:hypothetical protein